MENVDNSGRPLEKLWGKMFYLFKNTKIPQVDCPENLLMLHPGAQEFQGWLVWLGLFHLGDSQKMDNKFLRGWCANCSNIVGGTLQNIGIPWCEKLTSDIFLQHLFKCGTALRHNTSLGSHFFYLNYCNDRLACCQIWPALIFRGLHFFERVMVHFKHIC